MSDVVETNQAKQVAILVLSRKSERDIAKELNLTHKQVYRIKKSEEFEKALKELAEEQTGILLYRWKKRLESAEGAAWEAFMFNLKDKKNMEAVKEYLNMIGFKAKEEKANDGPVVQLIMPSAVPEPTTIVVPKDEEDA